METLVKEMLDGSILLSEALSEFEKLYIQAAMARNDDHLSNTANALGIHRNTLSKRVAEYNAPSKSRRKREQTARGKANGRKRSFK